MEGYEFDEKIYGNFTAIIPGDEKAISYIYNNFTIEDVESTANQKIGIIIKHFLFKGYKEELEDFYSNFIKKSSGEEEDDDEF